MSQAGTIRNFMVALGFQTDNSGLAKMVGAMQGVELKAKSLNAAFSALAVGAVLAVRQTASELDKLYFSSKRIGASAENINAYGNAISQMGGNAEQAIGTLESLAEKMRNSPGYEGMLNSLGVSTKQANGAVRDRVEVMKDLSSVLAKMPQYQANAYADSLGIDQNTLLAMRDGKFISNMEKYQKLQKDMGMNDDLTKSGNDFMNEYRDLTMMTKTGFQVIVMHVGKALIPVLRFLNQMIRAGIIAFGQLNPHVKDMLTTGLRFMLLASVFGVVTKFFTAVLRFVPTLKTFVGLLKVMRLTFLASPLGIITALITALGLLWDDYQTWKEGGKSLIDWGAWSKEIDYVIAKIQELLEWIANLGKKVIDFTFGEGTHQKAVDWTEKNIVEPVAGWFGMPTPMLDDERRQKEQAKQQAINAKPTTMTPEIKQGIESGMSFVTGLAQRVTNGVKELASVGNGSGFSFGKDVDAHIKEASEKYNLDEKILRGFIKMEGGWKGEMSPTGAIGTGQFTKDTWNGLAKTSDGKAIGMTAITKDNFRKQNDPRFDKKVNTLATAFLAQQNAKILQKHDLPVTGENLYLLHNMGGSLIPAMKGDNSINSTLRKNIDVNVANDKRGMSPVEFVSYQRNRFNEQYKQANSSVASTSKNNIKAQDLANFAQNAQVPTSNPYQSEVNKSNNTSSNITINQEYKTDMTINGARNPQESANAVKRQQDSGNTMLARNAQSVMV